MRVAVEASRVRIPVMDGGQTDLRVLPDAVIG
jgi:hypothetical protein